MKKVRTRHGRWRLARRPAFTLFEVLVAIALLGILATSVVTFVWRIVESRERLARSADAIIGTTMVLERIETDLLTSLAGQGETGIQGTADTLLIRSRSVTMILASDQPPDMQGTEYRLVAGAIEARRWSGEAAAGTFETMATGIERIRFRFHDGEEWQDSFDSARAGGLPVAIEVAVWLGDGMPPLLTPPAADEPQPDETPLTAPDRLRVVAVPDGPVIGARGLP